ncbi:MFS transporter [Kitasatospora cineracea]|uniref:Putative MFS family arabinose efflux permease n=1 Tax=Kitasatospora cineracea TaxID=88074 RepID=A0A8G1UDP8_9ACTN|nr:MFS transporter [Kitasatospora cineracea]ROR35351.1 putative MFS family arabinose efflux permease [Kitasatospora cineracea]
MTDALKAPSPVAPAPPPTGAGLGLAAVLALGTFAVGTDAFVTAGFLPAMASSLRVSTSAAGQSVSLFAACYALASPLLAVATARLPRRTLLVGALVLLAAANALTALAPDYPVLLAGRLLAALGAAAFTPTAGASAAALVRPERRGRALAVVIGGLTAATALGVPLGRVAAVGLGWRAALGAVAALTALCALAVRLTLPALPGTEPVPLHVRLAALRRPGVLGVLPLTVLGMAACYVPYSYSVPVLAAVGVSGRTAVVAALVLYGAGAVAGNLLAGRFADRRGPVRVLAAGYAAMAAAFAALAGLAAGEVRAGVAAVGALVFLWGASSWCQTPPQQLRLLAAAPEQGPLLVSLNASGIYLGIGAGSVLGGVALPFGAAAVFALAAVLALAAGALLRATTARTRA